MESLCSGVNLLVVLFLSGVCLPSSLGFPPKHFPQHGYLERPQVGGSQNPEHTVHEQQKEPAAQVNTVSVSCHPDSLEIVIKADLFEVGAPVNVDDLRFGVDHDEFCRATASSRDEYRVLVGLLDCGTKFWMTEDALVYTNLLIYTPERSSDGVIRMDEAVIPIECHYERRYSLSSSSLTPTWIPFTSTEAAVEALEFNLRVMTPDWSYERSSNVFYIGEPIGIEASVIVGHHMKLRVFVSSCVATLQPDMHSVPSYVFIEHGCLVDSQFPGSKSHFLPRTQDDQLRLVIDAFRFHNEDKGELYITCHLNAVPVTDAEAPNKACTSINGRWRSADDNDYLCGYCQSQKEVAQTRSKPSSMLKPRGFGKPEAEPQWRSSLKTKVWDKEERVGPMLVLPARQKSLLLSSEEVPPVLHKISRPSLYGSQWKSGINYNADLRKGLLPGPAAFDKEDELIDSDEDDSYLDLGTSGPDLKDDVDEAAPEVSLTSAALEKNATAALGDIIPTTQSHKDVTVLSNTTAAELYLSDKNPKRK